MGRFKGNTVPYKKNLVRVPVIPSKGWLREMG